MSINKGCSSKLWYTNCIEYYNTIKNFEDCQKQKMRIGECRKQKIICMAVVTTIKIHVYLDKDWTRTDKNEKHIS